MKAVPPASSDYKPVSAFSLFSKSRELVRRNFRVFGLLYVLPFITAVLGSFNHGSGRGRFNNPELSPGFNIPNFSGYRWAVFLGSGFFALLIGVIVAALYQALLYSLQIEGAQGKTPAFKHLWEMAKKYWLRLFGLSVAIGVIIALPVLLFLLLVAVLSLANTRFADNLGLGLIILLVIPYLVYVAIMIRRYLLAPFVMIDKNLPIEAVLRQSDQLSKNQPWAIWSIIGVMILLSLVGVIPIIGSVISFVLTAVYSFAPALRYEELKKLAK